MLDPKICVSTVREYDDTTYIFLASSISSKIHINNAANAIPAMHVVEPLVDGCKSALVGNVLIDLDLPVQVIFNETRELGSPFNPTKGGPPPRPSGN